MRTVLLFRALPLVLAAAIGLCPLAPPEHLHEATDADGHHDQVAHRHTLLHVSDTDSDHHDDEGVHVEDADHDALVNVDAVLPMPTAPASFATPAADVVRILAPANYQRMLPAAFVEQLIHGPPRASPDPRGPPSSPLL